MTAIAFSMPLAAATEPPVALRTGDSAACDFSGDGRLCRSDAGERSALAYPGFYLAIPAYALLILAVLIIRLCALRGQTTR
ncbi:hypothetical protein VH567_08810 [Sphingomonas sp. 4RDLI-65]|uniref:hypothetical protein n=1 Tax=Sphingomonas sp. 4RDLI-65 TaxID=3111641 RepID=UPI003C2784A8